MQCYRVMIPAGNDLSRCFSKTGGVPKQGAAAVFPNTLQLRFRPVRASGINEGGGGGGLVVEEESRLSLYEVLGIQMCGSAREIKEAYKKMARKYHPDVSPPDRVEEYTERFIRVHEAYETLSDPHRKAIYDNYYMGIGIQEDDEKTEWRRRWQSQLSELINSSSRRRRRKSYINSNTKSSSNNISSMSVSMSWGARMRSRKQQESP